MRLIFEEQKTWKLREASVQKFLRIIWIKLFVIWQVLKPPLRKLLLGRFFRFLKMAKSLWDRLPYFYKCKLSNSRLWTNNEIFWWNRLPVHVNMSWVLGLKWFWMKQFFTKAVLSLFRSNILLQISDTAHYNHIPLLNTVNVYQTSFQD